MDPESQLKKAFAESWLRSPNDPFGAAMKVTRNHPQVSLQILDQWCTDDEVLRFKKQLIAEFGEDHFLPSKEEMLHELYERARACRDNEDYVKLMRLAADMRGQIEKPGVNINTTVNHTSNKVMVVPQLTNSTGEPANMGEWEQSLIEQQQRLVAN